VHVLVSDDDHDIQAINTTIFPLFPGKDDDKKSERIKKLSNNFYQKLLGRQRGDTADLRKLFFRRTSSYKIQAFRQCNWFHETFGGPSMMV
jgi:hypothetical protein